MRNWRILLAGWVAILVVLLPVSTASASGFDPQLTVEGVLPHGALGLPGEPVTWLITVSNSGSLAGDEVQISNAVPDYLRIDGVETTQGSSVINEQLVVFQPGVLLPGQTVQMEVQTTVLRSPANGVLLNRVTLSAPDDLMRSVSAEIFVPTGLPSTGYPPNEDLPGEGEPSVFMVALIAFSTVALTAVYVWRRGSRQACGVGVRRCSSDGL